MYLILDLIYWTSGFVKMERIGNQSDAGYTKLQLVMFDEDLCGDKRVACTKYEYQESAGRWDCGVRTLDGASANGFGFVVRNPLAHPHTLDAEF